MKWAGVVLCLMLVAGWIGTYSGGVFIRVYPNHIVISAGGIRYMRYPIAPRRPPEIRWRDRPLGNMHALPYGVLTKQYWNGSQAGPDWWFDVPFWFLLLIAGGGTFFLWRVDRWRPGCCQSCGYDLTGNVSGRCPECGAAAMD